METKLFFRMARRCMPCPVRPPRCFFSCHPPPCVNSYQVDACESNCRLNMEMKKDVQCRLVRVEGLLNKGLCFLSFFSELLPPISLCVVTVISALSSLADDEGDLRFPSVVLRIASNNLVTSDNRQYKMH